MASPTIDYLLLAILGVVFAFAAISGIRTRRVPDATWWGAAIPAFGAHLSWLIVEGAGLTAYILFAIAAWFFYDIFWPRRALWGDDGGPNFVFLAINGLMIVLAATTVFIAYRQGWEGTDTVPLMMLIMIFVGYVLYFTRLMRGGADAKAFITIGIFFPVWPNFAALMTEAPETPVDVWVPLAFAVVLYAALLSMVAPTLVFIRNVFSSQWSFPGMFVRYKVPTAAVDLKTQFLCQTWDNGRIITHLQPPDLEDEEGALLALRRMGVRTVLVQYKIPFIVPMFLGLLIAALTAHPMLLLIGSG